MPPTVSRLKFYLAIDDCDLGSGYSGGDRVVAAAGDAVAVAVMLSLLIRLGPYFYYCYHLYRLRMIRQHDVDYFDHFYARLEAHRNWLYSREWYAHLSAL